MNPVQHPDLGAPVHIGIVVPDIDTAVAEMARALGLHFAPVAEQIVEGRSGSGMSKTPVRLTWSVEGPPHIELLQGPPGTVWSAENGRHFHHIGYWAEDIRAVSEGLTAAGLPLELAGVGEREPAGFAYHTAGGLRVEVLDTERKAPLERWLAAASGSGS